MWVKWVNRNMFKFIVRKCVVIRISIEKFSRFKFDSFIEVFMVMKSIIMNNLLVILNFSFIRLNW